MNIIINSFITLILFLNILQPSMAAQTANDIITKMENLDEKYKQGLIVINNQTMKDRMAHKFKEDKSKKLAIKAKLAKDKYQKQKTITEKAVHRARMNNVSRTRRLDRAGLYRLDHNDYERETRKEERKLRVYKRELDIADLEARNGYSNATYLDQLKAAQSKRSLASWYAQQKRTITEKKHP